MMSIFVYICITIRICCSTNFASLMTKISTSIISVFSFFIKRHFTKQTILLFHEISSVYRLLKISVVFFPQFIKNLCMKFSNFLNIFKNYYTFWTQILKVGWSFQFTCYLRSNTNRKLFTKDFVSFRFIVLTSVFIASKSATSKNIGLLFSFFLNLREASVVIFIILGPCSRQKSLRFLISLPVEQVGKQDVLFWSQWIGPM